MYVFLIIIIYYFIVGIIYNEIINIRNLKSQKHNFKSIKNSLFIIVTLLQLFQKLLLTYIEKYIYFYNLKKYQNIVIYKFVITIYHIGYFLKCDFNG